MINKEITIRLENGLEARPVALLVQVASQYDSSVYLETGDKRVNAKSIMGMMSLGLCNEEEIEVEATGNDEQDAVNAITNYIGSVA